jgi:hypothetical protein
VRETANPNVVLAADFCRWLDGRTAVTASPPLIGPRRGEGEKRTKAHATLRPISAGDGCWGVSLPWPTPWAALESVQSHSRGTYSPRSHSRRPLSTRSPTTTHRHGVALSPNVEWDVAGYSQRAAQHAGSLVVSVSARPVPVCHMLMPASLSMPCTHP